MRSQKLASQIKPGWKARNKCKDRLNLSSAPPNLFFNAQNQGLCSEATACELLVPHLPGTGETTDSCLGEPLGPAPGWTDIS